MLPVKATVKQEYTQTFQWRESPIHDQLQITQLPLRQRDRWQCFRPCREFRLSGRISRQEVLQDPAVGRVRHCKEWKRKLFGVYLES